MGLIDLKSPSGDDMKKVFTALANPETYKDMSASSLPGAQITIDGAFGFVVALGRHFTFAADLGGATISLGMNMGDQSEYSGYSNGIYATASTMELGGISADFNADLSVNSAVDLTISGNIGSNIGDFAFAAATTLGFTL